MKKFFRLSLMVAMAAVLMTSCNCYKKMVKSIDTVAITSTPEVLTLNNGKVSAEIAVNIPAKYFDKKAILRMTPVLIFQGGEVATDPIIVHGEYIHDNYTTVDFKQGATVKQVVEFKYRPEMRRCKLQLRIEALCYCSECANYVLINPETLAPVTMTELETLESDPNSDEAKSILRRCGLTVAEGINTLQADFNFAQMMDSMKDNYERVTTTVESIDLSYNINSSVVNMKKIDQDGVEKFSSILAANMSNDRKRQSLTIKGYASPDGDEGLNESLSDARSKSAKRAAAKTLKELGFTDLEVEACGEDWDGFRALVEVSNIEDKDLILRIMDMNETSAQRESELRNLSVVFEAVKEQILPQLRRAQIVNSIESTGLSDDEMLAAVEAKRYDELSVEEVLHVCANLKVKNPTAAALLKFAAEKYGDCRLYNNLGVVYAKMGKAQEAKAAFEMAIKSGAELSEISGNMALVNLMVGDVEAAEKYSKSAGNKAKCAVEASKGDYSQAVKVMSGYNAAVAYTIMGDYASAKRSLGSLKSADAEYLRAVIASYEGDMKLAGASLTSAVKKNKALAAKAEDDVNLKNLFESGFKL